MNDQELLSAFLTTRADDTFTEIVEKYTPLVFSICLRVLGDSSWAEDAVQATFIVLLREAGSLRANTVLSSWLFRVGERVARNMRISQIRRESREREAGMRAQHDPEEVAWESIRPELDGAVATLPAVQRDVIVLRYFEGLSRKDVAHRLNCLEGTVQKRLSRALSSLRDRLRGRGVNISMMALTVGLARRVVETTPVKLSGTVAAACLGKGAVSAAALAAADRTIHALYLAKIKLWTLGASIILALSISVAYGAAWLKRLSPPNPASLAPAALASSYKLQFSRLFGGSGGAQVNDVCADAAGNTYITGATAAADFPTTPGVYQSAYAGGPTDAFVSKYGPAGELIWSTFLGGPGADGCCSIKVDAAGCVYVSGYAGAGFQTTPGSFQSALPEVHSTRNRGFAAKLTADGKQVLWSSFVGQGEVVKAMDLDPDGNLYLSLPYTNSSPDILPASWFTSAFQKSHHGPADCGIIKISNDGARVLWAAYFGGSAGCAADTSLCVGGDHCPVILLSTDSSDMAITHGAIKSAPRSGYLAKLSADGSHLIFGEYTATEAPIRRQIAEDSKGNVFVATGVGQWPAMPGAVQPKFGGGRRDFVVAKYAPAGELLAATYLGGTADESANPAIHTDGNDHVLLVGSSTSLDFPVTRGAYQARNAGGQDGVIAVLANDLSTLLYSSYIGGSGDDELRACCVGADGALYAAGVTTSLNWPLKSSDEHGAGAGMRKGPVNMNQGVLVKLLQLPMNP